MPIFEYSCNDCGTRFEKLVRNNSEEIACPSCGEKHLKQELSVFAAHANSGRGKKSDGPMCPSGGMCPTPGACGLN
jgi:putative FmdB family regulatory protein